MADLLGDTSLGDDIGDQPEVDPAADFLAREQDDLAELGEDFGGEQPSEDTNLDFGEEVNGPVVNGFAEEEPTNIPITPAVSMQRESEPESVRKWHEEKAALLEKMDKEEKESIEEWREKAKKELHDWYERQDEQLGKTKTSNRADEEAYVAERDATSSTGKDWEKVCRMCDFNPKGTKNTKDVSRMRSILLQLKQNPLPGRE